MADLYVGNESGWVWKPRLLINDTSTVNFGSMLTSFTPTSYTNIDDSYTHVSFDAEFSELQCGTQYWYRPAAVDADDGVTYGSVKTFTTLECDPGPAPSDPEVTTVSATNIAKNSATLNGTATGGQVYSRSFVYGLTSSYGQTIEDEPSEGDYDLTVNNLECGTTYHFRAEAYIYGEELPRVGEDKTFTTSSCGSKSGNNHVVSGGYRPATTAVTTPTTPSCIIPLYPTAPIKLGAQNNPEQVKLLEQFLNQFENANLPVDGIYSTTDELAVKHWQEKYASEILTPWGETAGTGYIYTTSLAKIRTISQNSCITSNSNTPAVSNPPLLKSVLRDLTIGNEGEDVINLQKILNRLGYPLATSGPGSLGNETAMFGSLTQAALAKYQSANNIIPAVGYFGPLTRDYMKANGVAGIWW